MSSDLHTEMEMESPPHSPAAGSNVNMQEMDMEQDDEDMNVQPTAPQVPLRGAPPPPPVMISRMPASQMPFHPPLPPSLSTTALPPALPKDKLPTPFKPQDVIIKSYNPKGQFFF